MLNANSIIITGSPDGYRFGVIMLHRIDVALPAEMSVVKKINIPAHSSIRKRLYINTLEVILFLWVMRRIEYSFNDL